MNSYSNYPTGAMAAWLAASKFHAGLIGLAKAADELPNDEYQRIADLASYIMDWFLEMVEYEWTLADNIVTDLFHYGLGMVEWDEIAARYLELARETVS